MPIDEPNSCKSIIDAAGFRSGVGMILINQNSKVLWARRIGQNAWQFPQGGMFVGESAEQAMFRELKEEVGLDPDSVKILAVTENWLRYRLPKRHIRYHSKPVCIGQKQKWFLLELISKDSEASVCFDHTTTPEFDKWRWVDYWYPINNVVAFKSDVYRDALQEFAPLVFV